MGIRNYTNTGQTSTLTAAIGATDTTFTLANYAGDPMPPFTAALARGTATEEVILVTAVNGSTVTVTRGYDGTNAQAQGAGATFQEVVVALDYREANNHVNATSAHGTTSQLVGVSDVQTLTNKTLTSPSLSSPTLTGTASAATLNVTTLSVSGATTLGATTASTLSTSGLLTASGGVTVPTGKRVTLTDAPTSGTDGANKSYVDGQVSPKANTASPTFTGTVTAPILRLTATADASATSTGHAFQVGADNTYNTIIDNNEILFRNNGVVTGQVASTQYVDSQISAIPQFKHGSGSIAMSKGDISGTVTVNFGTTFASAPDVVVGGNHSGADWLWSLWVTSVSTTSCTVQANWTDRATSAPAAGNVYFYWIAAGS